MMFHCTSVAAAACLLFVIVTSTASALPPDFQDELVLSGLDQPITLDFIPGDGRLFVLQKGGQMLITDPTVALPVADPYMTITDIEAGGERGLIDIAFDPDFAGTNHFYLYYHPASTARFRVSRFTHTGNTGDLASEVLLWEDSDPSSSCCHYGGGLDFGPDGRLYLTIGEEFDGNQAQDPTRSGGSVIRINKDGTIPTDNPWYDGPAGPNDDSIWAIGLRNPFRAKWDRPTGRFFIAEVGGNNQGTAWEDVHLGVAGKNFGWPLCEGPCDNPDFPSCQCGTHDDPIFGYAHAGSGASISGGVVYRGNQFPTSYIGAYFYGDYVRGFIRYLTFDGTGLTVTADTEFATGVGAAVDFAEGPAGALFYANVGNGTVRRIVYDSGNQGPVITQADADVTSGPAGLVVNFTGLATDAEKDPLTYEWIFGDGDSAFGANATHEYTVNGRYSAQLLVSDASHTTASPPIDIQVGEPPVATLISPMDNAFFRAGETITLSATAMDPDGTLVADGFVWTVQFLHNMHVHPGPGPFIGPSAAFDISTSGHDFGDDTGYRITLTVTDNDGLTDEQQVTIRPDKVDLTFDTAPSGRTVFVDDVPRTAPFVLDTVIGFEHAIAVDETFCDGGVEQGFLSWTDGGAASHQITVPKRNLALTATYGATGTCPFVLYRVNAGGPLVAEADLDWASDEAPSFAYVNTGNLYSVTSGIDMTHPSVPPGTPVTVFQSERWDPAGDPAMSWDFPVDAGTDVEVRLHFSEIAFGGAGQRVFDVRIEGQIVLDDYDIAAEVGANRAVTKSVVLRSDGNIDIDFEGVLQNPKIAGIEILHLASDTILCAGTEVDCNANGVPDPCEAAVADQAMRFDGIDDWISIPPVPQAGDFTIEAWVRLEGSITNADGIVGQDGPGQDINFYQARVRLYAPGDVIIANTPTVPGQWTHYALTRSGAALSLYINGQIDATGTWSGVFAPGAIGRANAGFTLGEIDEVRLWNVARLPAEIQATMTTTVRSDEPGLVASWSFDATPSEQQVFDRAGSATGTRGATALLGTDEPFRVESSSPVVSTIDPNGNGSPDECCAEDLDGSGAVGFADITTLLARWGPCPVGPPCAADLDGSGQVGFGDLTALLNAFGAC